MRLLGFSKSRFMETDWISAIRIPRKDCENEISFASRNIDILRPQLPVLAAASLCYVALLAFSNLPQLSVPQIIWLAISLLISLPMLMLRGSVSRRLHVNPIRSLKEICIATAVGGLFWGSAGGIFPFPSGVAASLALFVIALVVLAALPTAQIVFVGSFVAGKLVYGGNAVPVELMAFALFFCGVGIWVSAHTRFTRSEAALALHRGRFARLSCQKGMFNWETDAGGNLLQASDFLWYLLGNQEVEAARTPLWGVSQAEQELQDDQQTENQLGFDMLKRCHDTQSSFSDVVVNLRTADGVHRLSLSGRPRHNATGGFGGFAGAGLDLTESSMKQEKLLAAAERDGLTKLINRACFIDNLEALLGETQSGRCATAMLLIDLDKFKQANDTLGHQVGDEILLQVAGRLCGFINSRGFVGRLGGDEFGVVLDQIANKDELAALAEQLIAYIGAPYEIGGLKVSIGSTIGIAIAPEHGTAVDQLVRNADLALYSAKSRGGNQHRFFDLTLLDHATERRQIEIDLKNAIERGQMSIVFQPIVAAKTERLCVFEALARWVHPERGEVAPAEFIPIAEASGLIDTLGDWVLRQACLAAAQWPSHITLAVNISPNQFRNPGLTAKVEDALLHAGLAPNRLELEITEGVFLSEAASTQLILNQLHQLGVRWTLDDFGTGYSSLKYLLKAPFSKIKIDREFVNGLSVPGSQKHAIVRTIVELAKILHMETTAEGIETINDLQAAKDLGCTEIQGFVYGPALTCVEAQSLANSRAPLSAEGVEATRSEPRVVVLRSAEIVHHEKVWFGTVRNVSSGGAMVESAWNAEVGDRLEIHMDHENPRTGTVRWVDKYRFGMEHDKPCDVELREREAAGRSKNSSRAA
jgi:diguanylate cyclase (GGDEF)-like protein